MRRALTESMGAFCLVFAGTGAIIADQESGGAVTHVGVSLVFGLVVMAMIAAFGDASGAHINPAVTLGFWIAGRFPGKEVPAYVAAQCAGALLASSALRIIFLDAPTMGQTKPAGPPLQSFGLEFIITLILMVVILAVSTGPRERGVAAGIAVGGVVGLVAIFAGPISGASMNPARSIAPAVVAGDLQHLWIYIAAPIAGAVAAVPLHAVVTPRRSPPSV